MAIDPLKLTNEIRNSYLRYLISSFRLKDHTLRELFYKEAQKYLYLNGPILEATPPFKKGCYLKDMKNCSQIIRQRARLTKMFLLWITTTRSFRRTSTNSIFCLR